MDKANVFVCVHVYIYILLIITMDIFCIYLTKTILYDHTGNFLLFNEYVYFRFFFPP